MHDHTILSTLEKSKIPLILLLSPHLTLSASYTPREPTELPMVNLPCDVTSCQNLYEAESKAPRLKQWHD